MNFARDLETWTPKLVGERMVEAVRWAAFTGGKVGPGGIKGSMPSFNPTLDDHLDEGWGLPETAGDEEPGNGKRLVVQATAAQITAYEAALNWPAVYLYPAHEGSARLLCLWVRCKVHRRPFEGAIKARYSRMVQRDGDKAQREWGMSRATAFRLRDRGLSIISVGLDRDGVPL